MCVSTCRKGIVAATTLLAGFAFVAVQPASAQPKEIPDFSAGGVGWQNIGLTRGNFLSVPGEPPPVANDPAYLPSTAISFELVASAWPPQQVASKADAA
jgi:hypothetical protein